MIIYHNNRCSKSREALGLLEKNNCDFEIRDYLKNPPSQKELKELLAKLKCKAVDIVRKKEPLYIEKFVSKKLTNTQWISVLAKNPILIERPIIINKNKAIIGRPASLILDII